jgi:hypothetical protein
LARQIYRSKTITAWLAAFVACEIGFVYFFIIAFAAKHPGAGAGVIVLNIAFSSSVMFVFRDIQKTFGFTYETDGATWVRRFGQGVEQRVTKETVTAVRRKGLEVVLVGTDQELPITGDCWGYEKLRDIAEEWAAELERKARATARAT